MPPRFAAPTGTSPASDPPTGTAQASHDTGEPGSDPGLAGQASETAIPLELLPPTLAPARLADLPPHQRRWAKALGFKGKLGELACLPDAEGGLARVLVGWGDDAARRRRRFHLAAIAHRLPAGIYALDPTHGIALSPHEARLEALGWLLDAYRFDRYKTHDTPKALLVPPEGCDAASVEAQAEAVALTRDLINTPAREMGPDALEGAFHALGAAFGAETASVSGQTLARDFPMIHIVGAAAATPPRLLDLRWGAEDAPKVTLVGKGVCFDTGGLDLKPASAMGLMKKDMGGAANVMGLARMIMAAELPVRLRVLVPAVENAVSGDSFRPGDVLTSRKGLTVEVNNTDAEGRLVLADALALACEETPAMILCMATLTGAARVALGPDLPAMFTDNEALAGEIAAAGAAERDPVWRLPLWPGYESLIEPEIAHLDNAPAGGMAGAITAALFLNRFVDDVPFVHFDIYAWTRKAAAGRPLGGEAQGIRALMAMLEARFAG
ncbi:MAG: leucyl aminopeptidase family protein [Pseudomonadota bacterium]